MLGLTYKKDVDDLRQSPAVEVVKFLTKNDMVSGVVITDPHVRALPGNLVDCDAVELAANIDLATDADVIAVLVSHTAFTPLLEQLRSTPALRVYYAERAAP